MTTTRRRQPGGELSPARLVSPANVADRAKQRGVTCHDGKCHYGNPAAAMNERANGEVGCPAEHRRRATHVAQTAYAPSGSVTVPSRPTMAISRPSARWPAAIATDSGTQRAITAR